MSLNNKITNRPVCENTTINYNALHRLDQS